MLEQRDSLAEIAIAACVQLALDFCGKGYTLDNHGICL